MIAGVRIGSQTIWLVDSPAPAIGHRRLLVAIDTSDSAWRQRELIVRALGNALAGLDVRDECWLWTMGGTAPLSKGKLQEASEPARQNLARTLVRGLREEKGGTWLRDTAEAMFKAANDDEAIPFILVITDGAEIFDAEAVAAPVAGQMAAAHRILSNTHQPSLPTGWKDEGANLSRWLALPAPEITLHIGDATAVYAVREDGELDPTPEIAWPRAIADHHARFAVVADLAPRWHFTVTRGSRIWKREGEGARLVLPNQISPSQLLLAQRACGLQLDWQKGIRDRLRQSSTGDISCPVCDRTRPISGVLQGEVFCDVCGAFVLVHGFATQRDPKLAHARFIVLEAMGPPRLARDVSAFGSETTIIPLESHAY